MISVITVTWNAEKTIEACIKSVASQVNVDYEHIILEGNSTDNTLGVCLARFNPNMLVFPYEEKGIYQKMNKAIKLAKGEWIYFLSADDVFTSWSVLPIFQNYATLAHPEADVIYGDIYSQKLGRLIDGEFNSTNIMTRNVPAMFYRKSVFDKIGYFNTKYPILADHDLSLRIFLGGNIKTQYIPLTTISFADGGISSTTRDPAFKKDFFTNCLKYIWHGSYSIPYKLYLSLYLPWSILTKKIKSLTL